MVMNVCWKQAGATDVDAAFETKKFLCLLISLLMDAINIFYL